MATPRLEDAQLHAAIQAVIGHETTTAAAHALGIARGTLEARINKAILAGITTRAEIRASRAGRTEVLAV